MTKYNCLQCNQVFSIQSTNFENDVRYCPFCGGVRPLTDSDKAKSERLNRKIIQAARGENNVG